MSNGLLALAQTHKDLGSEHSQTFLRQENVGQTEI